MNLRAAYAAELEKQGFVRDPAQQQIVDVLAELTRQLEADSAPHRSLVDRLRGRAGRYRPLAGLYVWGGVGRGKAFLMDLFFRHVQIDNKRRNHFHRIMHDVHAQLGRLKQVEDPLEIVAEEIARETRLLCFDEFFVSDIGDAMILGGLLEGLFARGVTLVATSNRPPQDLYKDGLQRQRFLPAIAAIERHTQVIELGGDHDYRLRLLEQAGTYLPSGSQDTTAALQRFFEDAASSRAEINRRLPVNGREIVAMQCGKTVVWFDYAELCDSPRSQADYLLLARWYHTVIVSDVPQFDRHLEDQARRFITLVDVFYDRRVKLIVTAAVGVEALYDGNRLAFEFERTRSRLIEMQSADYLKLPHLP